MKTEKHILLAFILNISFSIFEIIGGIFTNSVAIISDAIHDFGDALSIGLSYFLEKKSTKKPDNNYTYGYIRYSILGALITTTILLVGSIFVIISAVNRLFQPETINYNGMIIFAIIGTIINIIAAYSTKNGHSMNEKAVNLHMIEDVLGWIIVLIGSIIMKFTNIHYIDSIMSIFVALFIFCNAIKNFKAILDLFLEKTPKSICIDTLKEHLMKIDGVEDIHHIHIWSMDGYNNYATMHIVTNQKNNKIIKKKIREELEEHEINHATIEIEDADEICDNTTCKVHTNQKTGHHHRHHSKEKI